MKNKHLLPTILTATAIGMILSPALTVNAAVVTNTLTMEFNKVSPRYRFIDEIDAGVYPSSSSVDYDVNIEGTGLKSFSGTVTLYKETSLGSGKYTKIKSETINVTARDNRITHEGSAPSKGEGGYKVTYSGTVYTQDGSEFVSISHYNSY